MFFLKIVPKKKIDRKKLIKRSVVKTHLQMPKNNGEVKKKL